MSSTRRLSLPPTDPLSLMQWMYLALFTRWLNELLQLVRYVGLWHATGIVDSWVTLQNSVANLAWAGSLFSGSLPCYRVPCHDLARLR